MLLDQAEPDLKERLDARPHLRDPRTERLLAVYLRSWGLHDPTAISRQCRRWLRQTREQSTTDNLAHAALTLAMRDMDDWLDHLTLLVSSDPSEVPARRGLLAMELRRAIDYFPDALLQYESLPELLLQRLREAAHPIVPIPTQTTSMQGPPLGELPPLLEAHRWRDYFGRLKNLILRLFGLRRGK